MGDLKKWFSLLGVLAVAFVAFSFFFISFDKQEDYGVFIGMEKESLLNLKKSYKTFVLDATYLEESDIQQIRKKSKETFAYLNIGALEKSNSFYATFKDLTFKPYDNWPDESWIDVTNANWQEFLVHHLAKNLKDKGIDGLFLDNVDVYDHDQRPEVYQSLLQLLKDFKEKNLKIIVNGGSTFVSQLVNEDSKLAQRLIYAVNQESVFLAYDFDTEQAIQQKADDKTFYIDYLSKVQDAKIKVFVIEYGANKEEAEYILKQGKQRRYGIYFSLDILLNKE